MNAAKRLAAVLLALLMILPAAVSASPFPDVPDGKWYTEAVEYVAAKEYFTGTSDGNFEPKTNMSRAMFATVMAKVSGEDISMYDGSAFNDVAPGKWYEKAVGWANACGLVSGTGGGSFSPSLPITRQEVCVMLVRFVQYSHYAFTSTADDTLFADDQTISSWAKSAVYEVRSYGIVAGKQGNTFDPKGTATRAEVALMIMNLDTKINTRFKLDMDYADIKIDGAADSAQILHISDLHLTLTDENDPEAAVINQNARGDMFAAEIADSVKPAERLTAITDFYKQRGADLLAMSGDIIDAPSEGNLSELKSTFGETGINGLFAFGNHDWTGDWLGDYQTPEQWNLNTPKFAGIIATGEEKIAVREYDGFVVIALDNSDNQITQEQYAAVHKYIQKKTPIILMLHVPLDTPTLEADVSAKWGKVILCGHADTAPTAYTTAFMSLVRGKNSTIAAVLAGHVHMNHVDRLSENNNAVQYTLGASYTGSARLFNIHG